jgi:hypothetical protein
VQAILRGDGESGMKIRVVCAKCGGENVMRDTWAKSELEKQEWVLQTVFDHAHCDGEASLEELHSLRRHSRPILLS